MAQQHELINSMYCSCGQDAVTCQSCGQQVCGNLATSIDSRNYCPPCLPTAAREAEEAARNDPGCAYCHRGIDCEWHKGLQPEYIFVYGTLMSGLPAHDLLHEALPIGKGTIKGSLVDLGAYPAALEEGQGTIHGELYMVLPREVERLDRYESCYSEDPNSLYVRVRVQVKLEHGEHAAWVYFFNRIPDPETSRPIESGDYRQHLAEMEALR